MNRFDLESIKWKLSLSIISMETCVSASKQWNASGKKRQTC